jgi:hypothetical protein
MNRLFYNRCYLAGPIDYAVDFGVGWRTEMKKELDKLHVISLDPCHKPMFPGYECPDLEDHARRKHLKEIGDWETLAHDMREIRCIDLRLCDICDFAIVHLDMNCYSTGTHEELTTLNRRKAPILFHMEQGLWAVPDWVRGELPPELMFETWSDLTAYMRHIAFDKEIDCMGRWRFFDYAGLYGLTNC